MVWQRARKPEQKEQRRTALLEAAASLFEREGFEHVSLNAIAREANISKANIYRYFGSREELFLHILLDDYRDWVNDLARELALLGGSNDLPGVARAITRVTVARPRLCSLIAVLTGVLERNVEVDVVVWFKTGALEAAMGTFASLSAALPRLAPEQAQQLVANVHFMVAGMWPAANPPPAVREALERPELAIACVQFERDLEVAILTLLRGLDASREAASA